MQTLWIIVDQCSLILALLALLAPFLGTLLGFTADARAITSGREQPPSRRTAGGCIIGGLASPLLLFMAFCSPPPGEGVAARDGKAYAESLVPALAQFHRQTGVYPDSLSQLKRVGDAEGPMGKNGRWHWSRYTYRREGSEYVLGFSYRGPGTNECEFQSQERRWKCSGHF